MIKKIIFLSSVGIASAGIIKYIVKNLKFKYSIFKGNILGFKFSLDKEYTLNELKDHIDRWHLNDFPDYKGEWELT